LCFTLKTILRGGVIRALYLNFKLDGTIILVKKKRKRLSNKYIFYFVSHVFGVLHIFIQKVYQLQSVLIVIIIIK
jgi:hypothetical protein